MTNPIVELKKTSAIKLKCKAIRSVRASSLKTLTELLESDEFKTLYGEFGDDTRVNTLFNNPKFSELRKHLEFVNHTSWVLDHLVSEGLYLAQLESHLKTFLERSVKVLSALPMSNGKVKITYLDDGVECLIACNARYYLRSATEVQLIVNFNN